MEDKCLSIPFQNLGHTFLYIRNDVSTKKSTLHYLSLAVYGGGSS